MDFGFFDNFHYFVAIALVLASAMYAIAVNQLMSIRIQRPRVQLKELNDIPPYLLIQYQKAELKLKSLGFELHHHQLSQDIIAHRHAVKWTKVMINKEAGVYAEISPASTILDLPEFEIDLWSFTNDAGALLTVNGRAHTVLEEIPGAIVHDSMAGSLEDQFRAHLEEQKTFSGDTKFVATNAAGYIKLQQKLLDGYFLKLMKEKSIVSTGNNLFRITFSKALKLASQLIYGEKEVQKLIKDKFHKSQVNINDDELSNDSLNLELEADVQAYLRLNAAQERRSPNGLAKLIIFVVSLALSYIAFGLSFSITSVVIILGVLLFHELGHLAAMLLLNFRDRQVFFIPLFGVTFSNTDEDAPTWKQVAVFLMGPVPGLILGLFLLNLETTFNTAWLYETVIILLIVNYLNLLPILPMDGGHIVRLTIIERFPAGKLFFTILSTVIFMIGAIIIAEPVFWILAIAMLASIPGNIKELVFLKEILKVFQEFQEVDNHDRLAQMFKILRKPQFKKYVYIQKFDLVKSLNSIALGNINRAGQTGLFGIYLVILLFSPPAIYLSAVGIDNLKTSFSILSGNVPDKEWEAKIKAAETNAQRYNFMVDAAKFYSTTKQFSIAQKYLDKAEKSFSLINDDTELAKLYQAYAFYYQQTNEQQSAWESWSKILILYEEIPQKNYHLLATSAQQLAYIELERENIEGYEQRLLDALKFAANIQNPENRIVIIDILSGLLDYYHHKKKPQNSLKLVKDLLPALDNTGSQTGAMITQLVREDLAWIHIDLNNPDKALEQINIAIELDIYRNSLLPEKQRDSLGNVDLIITQAVILSKLGNTTNATSLFNEVQKTIKLNYYENIMDYIDSYIEELSESKQQFQSREKSRWKYIKQQYHSFSLAKKDK